MARAPALIPGLERVNLPEARHAIPVLHAYLRECVLDGTLTPGAKLSQVALADQLGVSRTPLREVLRMLQEEGLVQIEPNQRTRVAGLDARELDELYASRILLETLALSMTLAEFSAARPREAKRALTAMRQAAKSENSAIWFQSHGEFHRIITAGAGNALQRQLTAFADRSTRYIRICQLTDPASWHNAGDAEHAAVLAALAEGDRDAALSGLAHHLAGTAQRVLTECAPGYEINAVPRALELVAVGAANV
jgi:DNA-binding GntR family transcriptional regulator